MSASFLATLCAHLKTLTAWLRSCPDRRAIDMKAIGPSHLFLHWTQMFNHFVKESINEFLASSNTGSQNYISINYSPCYITTVHCSVQSDQMKGWSQKNCADHWCHFATGITYDKVFWMPKNSTAAPHRQIFWSLLPCMHCNQCIRSSMSPQSLHQAVISIFFTWWVSACLH